MKRVAFLLCSLMLAVSVCGQQADDMVVQTASGKVRGFNQDGSMAFLGIPYAKVERFMPPLPVDSWDGVRDCNKWGPQVM